MTADQQAEAIVRREESLAEMRQLLAGLREALHQTPREDLAADIEVCALAVGLAGRLHPRDLDAVRPGILDLLAVSRERRAA